MKEFDIKNFDDILSRKEDSKQLIDKLLKELKEDEEVYKIIKKLGLTTAEARDNAAKLTDFKDDYNYCKNCPGYDKCNKAIAHASMYIVKDGNYIANRYEPCKKHIEKINIDNRYLIDDFPSEWKLINSRNIDLKFSINIAAILKAYSKIIGEGSNRWLYIFGNHKTGKSFITVALANEYSSSNETKVAIVNSSKLFSYLADISYSDKEEFKRLMDALYEVELLVLDDFGEEYKNEYIRDQIVLPILQKREHDSKLTFFTSEFSFDEIRQLYSIGRNAGEIRGRQLEKILKSMCIEEIELKNN